MLSTSEKKDKKAKTIRSRLTNGNKSRFESSMIEEKPEDLKKTTKKKAKNSNIEKQINKSTIYPSDNRKKFSEPTMDLLPST